MEGNREPPKRHLKKDPGPRQVKRRLKLERDQELASGEWDDIISELENEGNQSKESEDESSDCDGQPTPAIAKTLTTYDIPTGSVNFLLRQKSNQFYPTMTRYRVKKNL